MPVTKNSKCPKCGGDPVLKSEPHGSISGINPNAMCFWVECPGCNLESDWARSAAVAWFNWNDGAFADQED